MLQFTFLSTVAINYIEYDESSSKLFAQYRWNVESMNFEVRSRFENMQI